jgi:hypothetical protein
MTNKVENYERMKANPEAKDLANPKEVWTNGTEVPTATPHEPESGPLGRVADAGTFGAGATSPYGTEIQAEIIAGQTMRAEPAAKPQGRPVRPPKVE